MMQLVSVDEFSSVHKQEVPAMALGKVASPRDVMPQPAVMPLASAPVLPRSGSDGELSESLERISVVATEKRQFRLALGTAK